VMGYAWSTDGVLKGDQLNACGSVFSATPSAADFGNYRHEGAARCVRRGALPVGGHQCGQKTVRSL